MLRNSKTTIICPCGKAHEVYWYIHGSGKKQLAYTCNNQTTKKITFKTIGGIAGEELRRSTKRILIKPFDPEFADMNPTTEQWSGKWKKKQQEEGQFKLPIAGVESDPELVEVDRKIEQWIEAKREAQVKMDVASRLMLEAENMLAELGKKRSELATPMLIP